MVEYYVESPSTPMPTEEECFEMQRERKQEVLDELDRQMVFRFQAGMDYSRLKWRKKMLLRRIAEKANAMWLQIRGKVVQ